MNDYEKAFQLKDPKYRSSILTNGLNKSGERALLYATGMDEEDLKKPFVAVIGSFSEMVPGHMCGNWLRQSSGRSFPGWQNSKISPRSWRAAGVHKG